ncbi:hypothetical protein CF319_g8241 [Tilletia indica]|nr:hypothetical protein CF319_g8241 [Tilletia indica]
MSPSPTTDFTPFMALWPESAHPSYRTSVTIDARSASRPVTTADFHHHHFSQASFDVFFGDLSQSFILSCTSEGDGILLNDIALTAQRPRNSVERLADGDVITIIGSPTLGDSSLTLRVRIAFMPNKVPSIFANSSLATSPLTSVLDGTASPPLRPHSHIPTSSSSSALSSIHKSAPSTATRPIPAALQDSWPDRPLSTTDPHRPESPKITGMSSILSDASFTAPIAASIESPAAHPPYHPGDFTSASSAAVETAVSRSPSTITLNLPRPSDSPSISHALDDMSTQSDSALRTPYKQLVAGLRARASFSIRPTDEAPEATDARTPGLSASRADPHSCRAESSDAFDCHCNHDDVTSVLTSVLGDSGASLAKPVPHPPPTSTTLFPIVQSESEACSESGQGSETNASALPHGLPCARNSVRQPLTRRPVPSADSSLGTSSHSELMKSNIPSAPSAGSSTWSRTPASSRGGRVARIQTEWLRARDQSVQARLENAVLAVRRVSAAWVHARRELLVAPTAVVSSSAASPAFASSSASTGIDDDSLNPHFNCSSAYDAPYLNHDPLIRSAVEPSALSFHSPPIDTANTVSDTGFFAHQQHQHSLRFYATTTLPPLR